MDAVPEPRKALGPGDGFRVRSLRGSLYEATFLHAGADQAGLYVRIRSGGGPGKLARLLPTRLDWKTLETTAPGEIILPGNEVLVAPSGGAERRGRLTAPIDDRLVMTTADGAVFSSPLACLSAPSFRLLFAASDLRPGDELVVRSLSGREYRGHAQSVDAESIGVALVPGGDRVALGLARLDMATLAVLIPVPLNVLGCSPSPAA